MSTCSEWYWETITNASNIFYTNCLGQNITFFADFPGLDVICVLDGTTPTYQTPGTNILFNTYVPCLPPTPTPTPTPTNTVTPTMSTCSEWYWETITNDSNIFYTNCLGQNITFFANFPDSGEICVLDGTTPTYQTPGSNILDNTYVPC